MPVVGDHADTVFAVDRWVVDRSGAGHQGVKCAVSSVQRPDPRRRTTLHPTTFAALAGGCQRSGRTGGRGRKPLWRSILRLQTPSSARNSGNWELGNRIATDAAMTSGLSTTTRATAAFSRADRGRIITVAGAGTSASRYYSYVSVVVSATQMTTENAAASTVSAAPAGIGTADVDGLHLGSEMAIAMVATRQAGVSRGRRRSRSSFHGGLARVRAFCITFAGSRCLRSVSATSGTIPYS